jgi:hypothetical protein
MTLSSKLLFSIGVVLLSGCTKQEAITPISPELQALRNQHGGATNWLECQQGIVVDVYTRYLDHNFMPRTDPLKQNDNFVRCNVEITTVQAIEISKSE